MSAGKYFNVRVYGLWVNEKAEVLVTDEYIYNKYLTKFPGGGLEFGEGLIDCLKREWREELNTEIIVKNHFYTTDFFQVSVFNSNAQVISIYYLVEPLGLKQLELKNSVFDFDKLEDGAQVFRFLPISALNESDLTLPIDQKVAGLLKENYNLR
jgi:8-oxo-dGTP diphosphatase